MKQKDFHCSITINTPVEKVFEAVASGIPGWWGKEMEGSSNKLNDVFTVHFGKTSGTMRIAEFIPNNRIVWQVMNCYLDVFKDKTQWNGTSIIWEFSTDGDSTILDMTHAGLTPALECYKDCEGGWTFFVTQSLFKLITEGKGLPGTGIRARISCGDRTYEGTLYHKEDLLPEIPKRSIVIDVKEREGEEVLSSYSVRVLNSETFNPSAFHGDYYMIVENKPVYENISPLEDLSEATVS
ncbi:MAG TPA: SRPBCC domain-containing protein [Puia sp.]|nr:SRPBCC domain-containing protein [Puia sp.]